MNVIILYEHISRELYGCDRIIDEMKKYKGINGIKFSITFEYYNAVSYAKKNGVDMVIMPWLYSDKDYELVMPFMNINPNVYIVNLHHEQIFSEISKNILLPKDESCKNGVIHFVWGDNFKKELMSNGVEEALIYLTGNIRTDTMFGLKDKENSKKQLSEKHNLDFEKTWILYSENRDWIWANKDNMFKVYTASGCSATDCEQFYQETVKSLNSTFDDIKGLEDDFFNNFEIIYRPHPGTLVQDSFDARIHIISEYSIYDWLQVVDANIVSGSTTIFESDMLGIASFVDNSCPVSERYQTIGVNEYPKLDSLSQISKQLIIYTENELYENKIYEKYIGVADGKRAQKIAYEINEILKEGNSKYKNIKIKYNKTRYILKFIREKCIKLMVKTNLLSLIKIPKMAYRMRMDIPHHMKCNK